MPSKMNWNQYFADCKEAAGHYPSTVTVGREEFNNEREVIEAAAALYGYKQGSDRERRISFLRSNAKHLR